MEASVAASEPMASKWLDKICAEEKRQRYEKHIEFVYDEARREHAFLLRCEGLTFKQVGKCLGIQKSTAQRLADRFAREHLNRMMIVRRTRFYIEP